MKDQHEKIKGYRDLSQEEIDMMNTVKAMGEQLGAMIANMRATDGLDQRWVSEANTDLQKGIMCAVLAIAKPTTF